MTTLVCDIETVGENYDLLDSTTQELLCRSLDRSAANEAEYLAALQDLKQGLGFSPLTGEIVAIGVLDVENDRGVVYYQSPGAEVEETAKENFAFKPCTEAEMLLRFWRGVEAYDTLVTFNGRQFDVPYLMIRSAVHQIRPSKNFLANRYISLQPRSARHLDLMDLFSFYGAVWRKGGLHLFCRAFGIPSPKAEGVTGDDVTELFRSGKFLEIAEYNTRDLVATKALYEYWQKYINI